MKKNYKIAILDMNDGQPNEGMRCIKLLVGGFLSQEHLGGTFETFEVRSASEVPELDAFDIFISSGGPGSPLLSGDAWETKYFALLDGILEHNLLNGPKKHLLLICHSFQLACLHWDLAKVTRRKSTSFGIFPIYKTQSGEMEVLLHGLNNPFYAVDSRDYQVVGPREWKLETLDGKVLCREKIRPHVPLERAVMAIRFSNEIFGVQFHPEADSEGMLRYFQREDKRKVITSVFGKEKYLDMLTHLYDEDKIPRTNSIIIPRFLQQAADAIDQTKVTSV